MSLTNELRSRPDSILDFWFGELDSHGLASEDKSRLWWAKNEALDQEIRDRFLSDHEAAMKGELGGWLVKPRSGLAFVILLDQFSRNMFRGTEQMFSGDTRALAAARSIVDRGLDRRMAFAERAFAYMPFEHSESLCDQHLCVRLCTLQADAASAETREAAESSLKFAQSHFDIVARFGRFPHRNEVLGRNSTPEELAFLPQPGSSF